MGGRLGDIVTGRAAVGLLIVRVVFGAALMMHGWQKIQSPGGMFGWMRGSPVPPFLQGLAAFAEFGGGLAWILGLLTPLAALGVIVNMLVAILMVHRNDPFVGRPGSPSMETAALYLAAALLLLLAGAGAVSLDALWMRRQRVAEGAGARAGLGPRAVG
jgi:putative oxidoreductase